MRLRRILAAAVVTVLAAPAALLATATTRLGGHAPPGSSAAPTASRGSTDSSYRHPARRPGLRRHASRSRSTSSPTPAGTYDGTLTVQRQLPGKDWKTIKTSSTAYLYDSIKAVRQRQLPRALQRQPATSRPRRPAAARQGPAQARHHDVGGRKVGARRQGRPKYKGKVIVFKKQGKKWKKFKTRAHQQEGHVPYAAARARASGRYYFWKLADQGEQGLHDHHRAASYYTYSSTDRSIRARTGQALGSSASSLARSASTSNVGGRPGQVQVAQRAHQQLADGQVAVPLLVARDDVPGRVLGVGALERELVRRAVVVPASRASRSPGLYFQCFVGSSRRASRRSFCSSGETCRRHLTTTVPSSVRLALELVDLGVPLLDHVGLGVAPRPGAIRTSS